MTTTKKSGFLKKNGLTFFMLVLGIVFLLAQFYTGWHENNDKLEELKQPPIAFSEYICSGHAIQSTFENLESEFLQMAIFVLVTTFLFQKGSSESNPLPEENKPDEEKETPLTKDSPAGARQKGFIKWLYSYSLSIILFTLFFISFLMHWYGSWIDYNEEQVIVGESTLSFFGYLKHCRFWFESFQNWQSEFISIAAIVFLSIYFRHKGSSQSKPVNMPDNETDG